MFKVFFQERPKKHLPAFWQDYEACFVNTYSRKTPLEEVEFVVFDTETSGLNVSKDKVLSIGAVRLKNQQVSIGESLDILISQPTYKGGKDIEVHGILPNRSHGGVSEAEALERFIAFCQDSVLVGHHIGFDAAMLNKIAKKQMGKKLKNKMIDTVALAMRINLPGSFAKPSEFTLDRLCAWYQLPTADRHTAIGDAYITALLFLKLTARLRQRGVYRLGQLLR